MATHVIQSYPDPSNQYTELQLDVPDDQAAPRLIFRAFTGGQLIETMRAGLTTPFLIRFHKYDLVNKQMFWGYFDFGAARRTNVTLDPAARKITIEYSATAQRMLPLRPPDLPADVQDLPDQPFDPITVTITLQAAIRTLNYGWINFDVKHTYPSQIPLRNATYAWQQTVHFPFLDFAQSNPTTLAPVITGPMNFAAVYRKTSSETEVNTATGIAIHVEDVHGHETSAWYDKDHFSLNYGLHNSIHLSGQEFVRPAEYSLSAGDAFGFGGNAMVYRVRAFQARGACPGAPVGWYDVLDIYRSWLRVRFAEPVKTSLFYQSLRPGRTKNAPVDEMAPHTTIANYGLDGAVDPLPASQAQLSGWLEMHPLRHAAPDTANAAGNASFVQLVSRLQAKFPDPSALKLEVQAWGIEQAGFYQFICGYPPLTNVISGDGAKFKPGVNALANEHRAALSITTDPLNTTFSRGRFAGHIRFKGSDWGNVHDFKEWEPFINPMFPAAVRDRNCAVTVTKIGAKQFNRIWLVENSPLTAALNRSQKKDEWGQLQHVPPRTASGLYRSAQKQLCPTEDLAGIYLSQWVQPWVIDQNVRILEFMKQGPWHYFCYRADHQHIVPHPHVPAQTNPAYSNVIGRGSWYPRRLRCMLFDAHQLGAVFDSDPFCTFRLIHEHTPREVIAPYIDEYYVWDEDETFDFVYSHLVAHHDSPGRGGWGVHPGYKEARQVPGSGYLKLDWMLHPDRDTQTPPPLRTPTSTEAQLQERRESFGLWRKQCVDHFKVLFKVEQWGIAPRGYPTGPTRPGTALIAWNPQSPLAPTNPPTYTYNRCVQQWFNLRASLFATGESAVRGRRIMIPSQWLEEPRDYDNEAVEHAVRASRLQMDGKAFFRLGRMLGETRIIEVNDAPPKNVWAWGNGGNLPRTFFDVTPLVDHIGNDDDVLRNAWRTVPLMDFISRPWDHESYPDGTYNEIVVTPQIQHRIWQTGDGDTRKVLYAFANVSNTDAKVEFLFSRGLEGVTNATKWRTTTRVYAPTAIAPLTSDAWAGKRETVRIPARSFAAVVVERI